MRTLLEQPIHAGAKTLIPNTYLGDSSQYQKFIIFAHQRSGSSMLRVALGAHPNILTFDELMTPKRMTFNKPGYKNYSKLLLLYRNLYPEKFLENIVFPTYDESFKAVGFKLFPEHLNRTYFASLWDWFDRNRDIKIILLTRDNYLETLASLTIAQETGKYGIKKASERPDVCITLPYNKCLGAFKRRKELNQAAAERFKNHDVYAFTYEAFIDNFDSHIQAVQSFLNVDIKPLEMKGIKKEVRPLQEVITNYDELKEKFADTEWSRFFLDTSST